MGWRGAILLRRIWLAREGHHFVTRIWFFSGGSSVTKMALFCLIVGMERRHSVTENLACQGRFFRNKMGLFCLIVGMERRHFVTENLACQGRFFSNKMALNRTAPFCYGKTPLARQIHRNKLAPFHPITQTKQHHVVTEEPPSASQIRRNKIELFC